MTWVNSLFIITLRINGNPNTRRSFLAILRETFTRIHNSFANLDLGEYVPVPDHPEAEPLDYQELLGLEEMGDRTVTIGKLKLRLDLRQLLDGYESIESRQTRRMRDRGDEYFDKGYEDMRELAGMAMNRPINVNAEATAMTDQSQKINNFNGPMSGVIGSDNAKVEGNTFTQINNATTTELLALLTSMRQIVPNFPEDIREEITIDLDDLEAELQKPEDQRNPKRLQRSLIALFTAATMIAAPIAGITDFTNNAIDIATKLHIELPQLPGK